MHSSPVFCTRRYLAVFCTCASLPRKGPAAGSPWLGNPCHFGFVAVDAAAPRRSEHFPEKWTSGFPQKMRPRNKPQQ
jgi:hypothetical protein